jgi:hypothetical protein
VGFKPEVPLVPLVPDVPLVPVVPLDPLVPLEPELPLVPLLPEVPLRLPDTCVSLSNWLEICHKRFSSVPHPICLFGTDIIY